MSELLLELKPGRLNRRVGCAMYGFLGFFLGGVAFVLFLGLGEFLLEELIPQDVRGPLMMSLGGISALAILIACFVAHRRRALGSVRFMSDGLEWSLPAGSGRLAYEQIVGIDQKRRGSDLHPGPLAI